MLGITSIITSVISVIVGLLAIWLSLHFYRMTNQISVDIAKTTDKVSNDIDNMGQKLLELLRESLEYERGISIKDVKTEQRLTQEFKNIANEKIEKLKEEIKEKIENQKLDSKLMIKLINDTINKSREIESESSLSIVDKNIIEFIRTHYVKANKKIFSYKNFINIVPSFYSTQDLINSFLKLRKYDYIKLNIRGSPDSLSENTEISITNEFIDKFLK
ncbi:MAG: hypothetical protein M1371_10340 [Actinobacteria bacterium]|nr:hypothetical protein [Actinomycetota bacterium]